jgi:hypothetical protein
MLYFNFLPSLAFSALSIAALTQEILRGPDEKDFPIPQPLPFNATLPGVNYDLIAKLRDAPNAIARIAMLQDKDFFDFISPALEIAGTIAQGKGGRFIAASTSNLPGLVDNGMSMAMEFTKAWFVPSPNLNNR